MLVHLFTQWKTAIIQHKFLMVAVLAVFSFTIPVGTVGAEELPATDTPILVADITSDLDTNIYTVEAIDTLDGQILVADFGVDEGYQIQASTFQSGTTELPTIDIDTNVITGGISDGIVWAFGLFAAILILPLSFKVGIAFVTGLFSFISKELSNAFRF